MINIMFSKVKRDVLRFSCIASIYACDNKISESNCRLCDGKTCKNEEDKVEKCNNFDLLSASIAKEYKNFNNNYRPFITNMPIAKKNGCFDQTIGYTK